MSTREWKSELCSTYGGISNSRESNELRQRAYMVGMVNTW